MLAWLVIFFLHNFLSSLELTVLLKIRFLRHLPYEIGSNSVGAEAELTISYNG